MGVRSNLFFRTTENRIYTNTTTFPGLAYSDSQAGTPDTMGAVGPNYFCELLNGHALTTDPAFAVYSKVGLTNLVKTNMNGFFAVSADGTNYPQTTMSDPRIIYDSQSQCFVASAIDVFSKQVILAVCTNADNATNLTAGWKKYVLYVLQAGATFTDFDTLSFDANGVYISVLQGFSSGITHTIVAIKKPDIYQGTNIAAFLMSGITNATDTNIVTLQPAINYDNVATNGYTWFVGKGTPTLGGTNQGGSIYYRRLQWSGTNAVWADTNGFVLLSSTNYQDYFDLDPTNANAPTGISAPQSNNPVTLYSVGSRLAQAVIRNGFLWTCHTVGLTTNGAYTGDASGSTVTRSGVQWFKLQISTDNTTLTLADHGRIFDSSPDGWYYYFPSIMVNNCGDMVAGFSGSTATNYMSALYSFRTASGSANVRGVIKSGTHATQARAGDYSATILDPTDNWSFWTVQEYGTNFSTGVAWGTVIAKIRPNP